MKKETMFYALAMPFIISASFEFLPKWLYVPIGVVGGMLWFGSLALIVNGENNG